MAILRMAQDSDVICQLCRLCLRKNLNCTPIFAYDEDGNMSDLPEIMKNCLDVEVHVEDGFSNMICQRCRTLLLAFKSFKESCQDSQQRLRRLNLRKQMMEMKRMSVGMVAEEESQSHNRPRPIIENNVAEKELDISASSQERGKSVCSSGDAVRPLAIWTVSQDGLFRANTANIKDEMIVSELLDDEIASIGDSSMEKEVDMEEMDTQDNLKHLEHHNYCCPVGRQRESRESLLDRQRVPEDMSEEETTKAEEQETTKKEETVTEKEETAIIKKEETRKEKTIAEEEAWIREANEDRTVLLKSLKEPPSPRMPLVIKQSNKAELEKQKSEEGKRTLTAIKGSSSILRTLKNIRGVVRVQKVDSDSKKKFLISQNKKKILISQNSKQVLRIPAVQAEPIKGRNMGDPVLKVCKTLQRMDEEKALQLKQKQLVEVTPKGSPCFKRTILVSKGDDVMKIVPLAESKIFPFKR